MGESNASLMTCEPLIYRPQWGAFGGAKQALSVTFMAQAAIDGRRSGAARPAQAAASRRAGPARLTQARPAPERRAARDPRRPGDLPRRGRRRAVHLRADGPRPARPALRPQVDGRARSASASAARSARARRGCRAAAAAAARDGAARRRDHQRPRDEGGRRARSRRSGLIAPELVVGVETGACPHTAIREDPSANIDAAERLEREHGPLDLS